MELTASATARAAPWGLFEPLRSCTLDFAGDKLTTLALPSTTEAAAPLALLRCALLCCFLGEMLANGLLDVLK